MKVGFIGFGNMARAIASSLEDKFNFAGGDGKFSVVAFDIIKENCRGASSNQDVINKSEFVFVCVKPQDAVSVLEGLKFSDDKILISIMAGISIKALSNFAKKIVRVMPNINAKVAKSVSVYCCKNITEEEHKKIVSILVKFGLSFLIEEKSMPLMTGLAGSSPAFVFKFIAAMVDFAICNGLDERNAYTIVLETMLGCLGTVFRSDEKNIRPIVNSVCSKNGTTIEGVNYLDEYCFEEIVKNAITKSVERAKELEQ